MYIARPIWMVFVITLLLVVQWTNAARHLLRDGNQKFRSCCARLKNADKECRRRFCGFDSLSAGNILFFLSTCAPRGPTVGLMWNCATSRHDHTECCKKKNVVAACLPYCSVKDVPTDYFKHLFCLQVFNPIRDCFQSHLNTHPNIFGDM